MPASPGDKHDPMHRKADVSEDIDFGPTNLEEDAAWNNTRITKPVPDRNGSTDLDSTRGSGG